MPREPKDNLDPRTLVGQRVRVHGNIPKSGVNGELTYSVLDTSSKVLGHLRGSDLDAHNIAFDNPVGVVDRGKLNTALNNPINPKTGKRAKERHTFIEGDVTVGRLNTPTASPSRTDLLSGLSRQFDPLRIGQGFFQVGDNVVMDLPSQAQEEEFQLRRPSGAKERPPRAIGNVVPAGTPTRTEPLGTQAILGAKTTKPQIVTVKKQDE